MKTVLQNASNTLQASTSVETCESGRAPFRCELRATNGQKNQVERLFPEFFTSYGNSSLVKCYKAKICGNSKEEQRPDDPLIQSWLNLYGGGSSD